MNKQLVAGNLTEAAVLIDKGERDMLVFTVASNDGPDHADFLPCVLWGKKGFADKLLPYMGVGQPVATHGELNYPAPSEKEGVVYNNFLVSINSIRDIQLMGGPRVDNGEQAPTPTPAAQKATEMGQAASTNAVPAPQNTDFDSFDDDIPF